jgi:hypothetical protein
VSSSSRSTTTTTISIAFNEKCHKTKKQNKKGQNDLWRWLWHMCKYSRAVPCLVVEYCAVVTRSRCCRVPRRALDLHKVFWRVYIRLGIWRRTNRLGISPRIGETASSNVSLLLFIWRRIDQRKYSVGYSIWFPNYFDRISPLGKGLYRVPQTRDPTYCVSLVIISQNQKDIERMSFLWGYFWAL